MLWRILFKNTVVTAIRRGVRLLRRGLTGIGTNNNRGHIRGRRTRNGVATHRHLTGLFSSGSFIRLSRFIGRHYIGFNRRGGRLPNRNMMANCNAVSNHLMCTFTRSFAMRNNSLNRVRTTGVIGMRHLTVGVNTPVINVGSSNNTHVRRTMSTLTNCNGVFFRGAGTSNIVPRVSMVVNPYTNNTMCSPTLASFVCVIGGASRVFVANPTMVGSMANRRMATRSLNNTVTRGSISNITRFTTRGRSSYVTRVHCLLNFLPSGGVRSTPLMSANSSPAHRSRDLGDLLPSGDGVPCSVGSIVTTAMSGNRCCRMRPFCTAGVVAYFTHFSNRSINVVTGRPGMVTNYLSVGTSSGSSHFVHFYSTFGVPVIGFISIPNFLPNAGRR